MQFRAAVALAFLSGFVALGYEILWARRLADVIGATALASSLVVGVFFVLLAAGAIVLGPLASRAASPWRLYASLEAGILVAILPAFFGDRLAALVAHGLGDSLLRPGASLAVKTFLALVFVGPASFLMGGTLPAMAQAVVRAGRLGREGNVLYGANTLGGALGILVTTFALAPALGVRRSFLVLMATSAAIAILAWRLGGAARARQDVAVEAPAIPARDLATSPSASRSPWTALAFVSGLNVLGLEILALHLFSQVLHNSIYTFATVLFVVIAALAIPALVVPRATFDASRAVHAAVVALLATALVTALVPRFFFGVTHELRPLGGGVATLGGYIVRILGAGGLVLGPPFLLAGFVFPLVLGGAGLDPDPRVAARWGKLLGANAAGALAGAVLVNFVCMRALGLWLSFTVWSAVTIVAGLLVASRAPARGQPLRLGLAAASTVAILAAFPGSLPVTALAPGDSVLGARSGPDGVAAVVANSGVAGDRRIKFNNTYTLGGVANAAQQARMGHLALLLHPKPERVGFIGIATGITASSALRDPAVSSLTAVELSPEITALACRYFADANADLCDSPKTRVVIEDGRMFFRATRDTYDVIIGDLFVPWQAGTANLYTREQFEAVRDRLAPGGLFAQWLPVFQLDAVGFFGIVATFASVFPNAWLAIADFQPYNPALALIGWKEMNGAPSHAVIERRCAEVRPLASLREPMLADATGVETFLVGPVAHILPEGVPLMTLDRPWLADHAPRVQRARPEPWFVGPPLVAALQRVTAAVQDDTLRAGISLGQCLYAFCEVTDREGTERAAAWLDRNLVAPLPALNFLVERPGQMSWPFRREAGLVLLAKARATQPQATSSTPVGASP